MLRRIRAPQTQGEASNDVEINTDVVRGRDDDARRIAACAVDGEAGEDHTARPRACETHRAASVRAAVVAWKHELDRSRIRRVAAEGQQVRRLQVGKHQARPRREVVDTVHDLHRQRRQQVFGFHPSQRSVRHAELLSRRRDVNNGGSQYEARHECCEHEYFNINTGTFKPTPLWHTLRLRGQSDQTDVACLCRDISLNVQAATERAVA